MATALPYRGNSGSTTASFERGPLHRHTSSSSNPANRSTSTSTGSNPKTRRLSRSPQPPSSASHNVDDGVQILSDHSSSSRQQQRAVTNKKPLRSQYPRGDPENHVEYILVASFDIDRGPIMEHQYPGPITGDENMLAELMLPDQAHVRNQDWTIFFLHKDAGEGMDGEQTGPANRKRRRKDNLVNEDPGDEEGVDEDDIDEEDEADETDELGDSQGPPLIYVLNLVYTKQDNTVKRGDVVKAMAICTRHSFLHIYKPLLLLALEEYYKAPYMETLASLYGAVNSMDLSLMPRLSILERFILQSTNIKEMFVEKFEQMIQQRVAEDEVSGNGASSTQNPKSTAELLKSASSNKYQVPRDTHEYESRVLYNGIPIPIKVPVALSPETVGDFSLIKLIQTFSTPHSSQPQPFALHAHLTTGGAYTHPIIVLMNAMLTQKRIIFLGHNQPSGDVAEAVLAACSLASGGVLRGFVRHAFPYTDLSKIDDLLNVPGFIAGVTNPTFALHPEWWDLLCDLPTGRMKISNVIEPAPVTEGLVNFQQHNPAPSSGTSPALPADPTGDAAFMEDVLRGISTRLGERAIRAKWRDWVIKFTRIAAAFEESVYGASALYIGGEEADAGAAGVSGHGYVWGDEISRYRELSGNVNRIEGWRNTRSYYSFIQDLANLYTARPISNLDLEHQHDRLRTQKLSHDDAASIYLAFASTVHSYPEICQLLTVTLEAHGGLFYISLGLFHPRRDVRAAIVHLLDRIREHEAGRHIWNVLGRFAKIGFLRVKREVEAAEDGDRDGDP